MQNLAGHVYLFLVDVQSVQGLSIYISKALPPKLSSLSPEESVDIEFRVIAMINAPLESPGELRFNALAEPFLFETTKEIIVGLAPYYNEGDIPSTFNTNPTTASNALEPGQMTVTIPEGATITGVDVSYNLTSHGGAWMSEQRSFLRCVSEGGTTEPEVYSGSGSFSGGTVEYQRTDLDIANDVLGGGDIHFELHAFRTWGGTGSNLQYAYVPNNTWKIIVYYELPRYDVTFRVSNQFEEMIEGANIEVSNQMHHTDLNGEAHTELPAGIFYYSAIAEKHRSLALEPFEVDMEEENLVEIIMTRVFEITFEVMDVHGNVVPDPVITFDGEVMEAGQFTIYDLETGSYLFMIEAEGYQTHEDMLEIYDSDVDFTVEMNPYYNLGFDVIDEFGNVVEDASISIEGQTYAEGEYEMEDYIPGVYNYTVSAVHYFDYEGSFQVYDDDVQVNVVLEADGTFVPDVDHTMATISPNPARDVLFVHILSPLQETVVVSLLDISGKTLQTIVSHPDSGAAEVELDVSGMIPGVYFVRINNDEIHQVIIH